MDTRLAGDFVYGDVELDGEDRGGPGDLEDLDDDDERVVSFNLCSTRNT